MSTPIHPKKGKAGRLLGVSSNSFPSLQVGRKKEKEGKGEGEEGEGGKRDNTYLAHGSGEGCP
jgi:hypothetical protein